METQREADMEWMSHEISWCKWLLGKKESKNNITKNELSYAMKRVKFIKTLLISTFHILSHPVWICQTNFSNFAPGWRNESWSHPDIKDLIIFFLNEISLNYPRIFKDLKLGNQMENYNESYPWAILGDFPFCCLSWNYFEFLNQFFFRSWNEI